MITAITAPNPPATPNLPATTTTTNSHWTCKIWGRPCPFFTKLAPVYSPMHSYWSDEEDWDGVRQKENKHRAKEQVEEIKEEENREKERKT